MNILVLSHEFPPIGGGGANACYYLTKGFAKKGNQVTVITSSFADLPEREALNGVNIIRVKARRSRKERSSFYEMLTFLWSASLCTLKMEKNERYDICHVFFGIPSGPVAFLLKKCYKTPYIIRFGGGDIPGAQKRFSLIYKVLSPFLKLIWRNANALIANSEGLKDRAEKFYNKKPIYVISNGVDSEIYKAIEHRSGNEINILFVSRLIEGKGLQHIIPMMEEIQAACPKAVKLVIIGDGPYKEKLEEIAQASREKENIIFMGRKGKEEIIAFYKKGDIFILPSESEGMPNVVLEAMSIGLPIIITPCEGSKELVSDNGYIVEVREFKDRIISLCNNEELRIAMGQKSAQIVRKEFTWETAVLKYISLCETILTGR